MAALHALCPKEIKELLDLQWDEIGEDYQKMKGKVVAWATNRAEKKSGPVPMEIGRVMTNQERGDLYEDQLWQQYWQDEWYGEENDIDAISPSTQCYNCGKYGHVAKGCSVKGKGKGGLWR